MTIDGTGSAGKSTGKSARTTAKKTARAVADQVSSSTTGATTKAATKATKRATKKASSTARKATTTATATTRATAKSAAKTVRKATAGTGTERKTAPKSSGTTTRRRPDHDIVLYGATGFTGKLVAARLAKNAPTGTKIALAGRSRDRLGIVRDELSGRAGDWPLVIADSSDEKSLGAMAESTNTVITTVGPYAEYGLPVVEACAKAGINYCDLTGEVLFMRESIDRYDAIARANKARIVHSCGFDSIPSDLGVLALSLAARHDDPEARLLGTRFIVTGAKGGVSGGTIASGLNELERAKDDKRVAELLADPYSLSPDRAEEPRGEVPQPRGVTRDDVVGAWLAPFIMGPINSPVVRRSNALADYAYGRDFQYAEYVSCGDGVGGRLAAAGMALGMTVGEAALSIPQVRSLAGKVLPEPGEGPSDETRAKGYFSIALHTRTADGVPYRAKVAAQGDPGYAATSMMLATTGLTLAGDGVPRRYGVLTPSTAVGELLIHNLRLAGMTIQARKA